MKYSKEKQNLHIELIRTILKERPDISARALWQELDKKDHHLSRAYTTKLLWRTCDLIAADSKAKIDKKPEFDAWFQRLVEVTNDIEELKRKVKQLILEYPDKAGLPPNFWI